MTTFDADEVRSYMDAARTGANTDAQGKAYEALAAYLFGTIPGCITQRDGITVFRSEQIDVAVCNSKHNNGLFPLPHVILIECKNWSSPVDSSTVGYFINILRNKKVETGILIAANGITGDPSDLTNAYSLGMSALSDGIKLVIITSDDIEKLTCTEDLVKLVISRFMLAYLRGGIGGPTGRA